VECNLTVGRRCSAATASPVFLTVRRNECNTNPNGCVTWFGLDPGFQDSSAQVSRGRSGIREPAARRHRPTALLAEKGTVSSVSRPLSEDSAARAHSQTRTSETHQYREFQSKYPDETNDLQPRFSRIHISLVMWCVLQRAQNYPKMKEPTRERWARRRAGSD